MAAHSHLYHHRHFLRFWREFLAEILGGKCYSMVEAVEPFRLHPTSMPYIHKVFEHLQLLWMVAWLHTHTITTTYIFLDLRELANILGDGGDVNEQTMLLCNG